MISNRHLRDRSVPPSEPLESRRMLSATVLHHVLQIDGTRRSDAIVVTPGQRAVTVSVNGQASEFSLRTFNSIKVRAGNGNDQVAIGTDGNPIFKAVSVLAGTGNDTVVASAGDDSVEGDEGNDIISTARGNDVVHGGGGHDTLFGGDGDDQLFGDNNADCVLGNAGADSIRGGRGDDELHDGAGKDAVFGDAGNDHFCVAQIRKEFRDAAKTEVMTTDHNSEAAVIAWTRSKSAGSPVIYSLTGDASLDGTVNSNDLLKLAQKYNTDVGSSTQALWNGGDFNYDGITDFNDLVKLAQNYNLSLQDTNTAS